MSSNQEVIKRRGRPKKADSELVINSNSIAVRNFRERKRLENEGKLLEEQRVYKNMYNKEWKTIRANKPDYSNDPSYEELAAEDITDIKHINLITMMIKILINILIKILIKQMILLEMIL